MPAMPPATFANALSMPIPAAITASDVILNLAVLIKKIAACANRFSIEVCECKVWNDFSLLKV